MRARFTILLFLSAGMARAGVGYLPDHCSPDGRVCTGDSVFRIYPAHPEELRYGPLMDLGHYDPAKYASARQTSCVAGEAGGKLCPGDRIRQAGKPGVLLAAFGDGSVVVSLGGSAPAKMGVAGIVPVVYVPLTDQEVRGAVGGLAEINEILAPGAPPLRCVEDQPGSAPPIEAKGEVDCHEEGQDFSGSDSPRKNYFEGLLARGLSAPLDDFLRLWYPDRAAEVDGSPYFPCETAVLGGFGGAYADDSGRLRERCQPESLYSWGPPMKLEEMRKKMPDGASWKGLPGSSGSLAGPNVLVPNTLYATASPASTFGYGPVLVRVKPKDDAQMLFGQMSDVVVRKGPFHDFWLNDAAAISGWAYGVPEIYDEVVRDVWRFRSEKRVTVYTEIQDLAKKAGLERLWGQAVDSHRQDETVLKMNLLEMIREILMKEGKIHYAAGECRNRRLFFSARRPTYFNPNKRPD